MLAQLTPEQAQAVTHPAGPLLVLAGAGAGKTRVLCHRLAWLIEQGEDPAQVLALTFTRQAAEELRGRAEELLGISHETLRVSTFHSWAHDLVQRHGVEHGLAPATRQVDPELRKLIVLDRLAELDLRRTTGRADPAQIVDRLVSRIDRCRDELVDAHDYLTWAREAVASAPDRARGLEAEREREFAEAFVAHDRWLAEEGLEDFGMSLVRAVHLVRTHADRRDAVQRASQHLLVDEFQDTNHAQAELLFAVHDPQGSLVVVGDDDQGIYRFRGASTKNIADFRRRFPGCAEVRLERNYRSTQVILDAAWSVVRRVPERVEKRLTAREGATGPRPAIWQAPDPDGQARAIADEILRQAEAGVPYEEQAVLMRAVRTEAAPIVAALERAGIPHQVRGGLGLMDRREVRIAIAWLRAISDPRDAQAHLRIAADPALGAPWEVVADVVHAAAGGPVRTPLVASLADAAPRLGELLDALGRVTAVDPPPAVMRAVLDMTGLRAEALAAGGAEGAARLASLAALENLVVQLSQFAPHHTTADIATTLWGLAELGYRGDAGTAAERRGVQVMTIHQSKGLEFDVVYVVGLTHRAWPGRNRDRSDIPDALLPEAVPRDPTAHLSEARRLAYVAMTRARHTLVLSTVAASGDGYPQRPSAFVDEAMEEIPGSGMVEVGLPPAHGVLEAVGRARERLEATSLAAARMIAAGGDETAAHEQAQAAMRALVAAQADALRPHVPQPIPTVVRPAAHGTRCAVTAMVRYMRCPLQYRYAHVDRIPGRADDPLRGVGNAAHTTMEATFRPESDVPPAEQVLQRFGRELERFGVRTTAQGIQAEAMAADAFPRLIARTVATAASHVSVERPFTLTLGAHRLHGRIDRIDRRRSGAYALVDYKTGTPPPPSAADQGRLVLHLYLAGARQAFGITAEVASLEYVLVGDVVHETPTAADMTASLDTARATLDAIAEGHFAPTPGWVCRSCDYRLLCPAQDR